MEYGVEDYWIHIEEECYIDKNMGKNIFIIRIYMFWNTKKNYFWKRNLPKSSKNQSNFEVWLNLDCLKGSKKTLKKPLLKIHCKVLIKNKEKFYKRLAGWLWRAFKGECSKEDLMLTSLSNSLSIFFLRFVIQICYEELIISFVKIGMNYVQKKIFWKRKWQQNFQGFFVTFFPLIWKFSFNKFLSLT